MKYKGYTQGDTVVLVRPIPVPDGTEVSIVVSKRMENMGKIGRQQLSVAEETFGLIPADSALVRQVLEEDLQEDLEEDLYDA
jgi:hypothetical protein